jgi:hypothetical protein
MKKFRDVLVPALMYPSLSQSISSDNWFTILNPSDLETRLDLGFEVNSEISEFVRIEVMSRENNIPLLETLSLSKKGSLDVKVKVFLNETARISLKSQKANYLLTHSDLVFGNIWLRPKLASEEKLLVDKTLIPVKGSLVEGPSFTVSTKNIQFRCAQLSDSDEDDDVRNQNKDSQNEQLQFEEVVIANNSHYFPLLFTAMIQLPSEVPSSLQLFKIEPLDSNNAGLVEPGGRLTLKVTFLTPNIKGLSEVVRLDILDVESLSQSSQTIFIEIIEDTTGLLSSSIHHKDESVQPLLFDDQSNSQPQKADESFESEDFVSISDVISSSNQSSVDRSVGAVSRGSHPESLM